jgi:hypothetical protein
MYFILMPGSLSAAQIKEQLATQSFSEVKVGGFNSLLDTLAELYLLPNLEALADLNNFSQQLRSAALTNQQAFWANSIAVDESAVLQELEATLAHCYQCMPLHEKLNAAVFTSNTFTPNSSRIATYLNDVIQLAEDMQHQRPNDQTLSQLWLNIADEPCIEALHIVVPKDLQLQAWQLEVIEKLQTMTEKNAKASELTQWLTSAMAVQSEQTALNEVASALFSVESVDASQSIPLDILNCRDSLEESEVLVSRIQQAIHDGVNPSDIAVVLPNGSNYQQLLPHLFREAGIPVSNLGTPQEYLEWDIQLIKDLITLYAVHVNPDAYLQDSQLGAVLVSPLMPWSLKFGQHLFESYQFSGEFKFIEKEAYQANQSESLVQLLHLLEQPNKRPLIDWLLELVPLLSFPKVPAVFNASRLQECISQVTQLLETHQQLPLHEACLLTAKQLQPQRFILDASEESWLLNSVLVVHDKNVLVNPVQHLFIVGFNDGSYQPNLNAKGVFQKSDWQIIAQHTSLDVYTSLQLDLAFEQRVARYFNIAQQSIQISLSEQAFDGSTLQASQTLVDLAILLQPLSSIEPHLLITAIKTQPSNMPFMAYNSTAIVQTEKPLELPQDLNLEQNLFALHTDHKGDPRTESPSSLDKMLVSPLAWLLDRQGLKPKGWNVEDLSVSLMGTIAHKAFELHFEPTSPHHIGEYDALFDEALRVEAAFLQSPKWRMECKQLRKETFKALEPFVQWCEAEGWQSYMQEGRLTGELFGLPIKGFVDAIFKNESSTLILDYKRSSSKKFVTRLSQGYDLQTMMYRKLLEQKEGGVDNLHSGYFTLNDATLILDEATPCNVPALRQENIAGTISAQSAAAELLLKQRIAELKQGIVKLNFEDHQQRWDQRGINTQYSVDANPLVGSFLKPTDESEQEAEA